MCRLRRSKKVSCDCAWLRHTRCKTVFLAWMHFNHLGCASSDPSFYRTPPSLRRRECSQSTCWHWTSLWPLPQEHDRPKRPTAIRSNRCQKYELQPSRIWHYDGLVKSVQLAYKTGCTTGQLAKDFKSFNMLAHCVEHGRLMDCCILLLCSTFGSGAVQMASSHAAWLMCSPC